MDSVNHSARRLNELARQLDANRYLEIGVETGATFLNVEIAERTGVDPNFKFDTESAQDSRTRLVERTSDRFFADEPIFPPYDIVFIDGLHVFEQVLRDLSNALLHSHRRSAILLDDTVPSDVYSSFPNQALTYRFRPATGNVDVDLAWHGDVFKTVFLIHDFFPGLNYRTISGPDNCQTLIWRSKDVRRVPLFDSLERISRLTFFDLKDHDGILKYASEDDAIASCVSEIKALI